MKAAGHSQGSSRLWTPGTGITRTKPPATAGDLATRRPGGPAAHGSDSGIPEADTMAGLSFRQVVTVKPCFLASLVRESLPGMPSAGSPGLRPRYPQRSCQPLMASLVAVP